MRFPSMKIRLLPYRSIPAILLLALIFSAINGCTTFSTMGDAYEEVVADARPNHRDLKQKLGLAVFGFNAFPTEFSFEEKFQQSLIKEIESTCPDVILVTPDNLENKRVLTVLPRHASGQINNYQLALEGRSLGLNAIITGDPVDISEEVSEEGLLWFKDTHNYARIRIPIDVYDTTTASKLLGDIFIRRIEVDPKTLANIQSKQVANAPELEKAMADIADEAAEKICDVVDIQQWKGFVTSISGNRLTLSSGKNSGLKTGDILEIFSSQNTISGVDGQKFFLPGDKIGELRIRTVDPDQAVGDLIFGSAIPINSIAIHKE